VRPPSQGFKLLAGYCAFLALMVSADQAAQPAPQAEAQFVERFLEMQVRWLEASNWMPQQSNPGPKTPTTEQQKPKSEQSLGNKVNMDQAAFQLEALTAMAKEAATLAQSENTPPEVKEQAAAIWWILVGSREKEENGHQLKSLLPPAEARSELGFILSLLNSKQPIDTVRLSALQTLPISRWLKSRLRTHILDSNAPITINSPHAKSEIEYLGGVAFIVMIYLLFALGGFLILIGWPFIRHRIPNAGAATPTESPFAPETWVGAYVVLAWFAFFVTSQIIFGSVFGRLENPTLMSFMTLVMQLAHGFFGLWVIGQLGMDGPRQRIGDVLKHLNIGLEAYGGRISKVLKWGFGGYAIAIPFVVMAAMLQSLIPLESNLVSNPILPLLADPPDAFTQLILVVAVIVAAPFFEECLFRGFLFRQLRKRMGVGVAVVISSALFAAVHFDAGTFLHLFALGCVLAIVAERSGGILASMLVHGFWNGATVLMTVSVFGS